MEISKAIKDSGKSIPVTHYTCIGNTKEKIKQELQRYLDGSRLYSFDEDITHLRIKQDSGADYIMTQLCYYVDQYCWWVEKIRRAGVSMPIDVGVMPILSKDPTIRMAVSNGSSIPRDLAEIIARYGGNPEDFKKAGKEYSAKQIFKFINAGIDGLHIYSLNKWQDVTDIIKDVGIGYSNFNTCFLKLILNIKEAPKVYICILRSSFYMN
jgi:methylenetetrahydrofolate reductase (NADPH)